MPLEKPVLERQLQQAEEAFAARREILKEKGVAANQFKRDPKWRHLKSSCADIRSRISSNDAQFAVDEEAKRRKEEKASLGDVEKTSKKEKKGSKGDGKKKQKAKKKDSK